MNVKTIMIIALAVLASAGGTAAYFLFTGGDDGATVVAVPKPGIVELETFMANINDPAGDRYVKLKLSLTVTPASFAETLHQDPILLAKIRDRVLTILTSKSIQELIGPLAKEGFRHEIKANLGPLLEDGEIQDVLFSDFVIQ